jgi:hypothetical protein
LTTWVLFCNIKKNQQKISFNLLNFTVMKRRSRCIWEMIIMVVVMLIFVFLSMNEKCWPRGLGPILQLPIGYFVGIFFSLGVIFSILDSFTSSNDYYYHILPFAFFVVFLGCLAIFLAKVSISDLQFAPTIETIIAILIAWRKIDVEFRLNFKDEI